MSEIYCLINDGGVLDSWSRHALFSAARMLYKRGKKRIEAKTDDGNIVVETQLKTATLGTVLGIKFNAKIERGSKTHTIEYIVSPKDFPRLKPGEMLIGSWLPDDLTSKPELN